MKWTRIGAVAAAVAVLAGTWAVAQTSKPAPATNDDQRIGRILEQNEKVLKNQEEILKTLASIQQDVTVLKFRSH